MLDQLKLTKHLNAGQLVLAFFPDRRGACLHSSRFVYYDGRAATRTARRPGFFYHNRGRTARAPDVQWESDRRRRSGRTEAFQSVRRGSLSVESPVEAVHLQHTKNSVLEPSENAVPTTRFDSLQSIAEAIDTVASRLWAVAASRQPVTVSRVTPSLLSMTFVLVEIVLNPSPCSSVIMLSRISRCPLSFRSYHGLPL
jgi:hypothetical protein